MVRGIATVPGAPDTLLCHTTHRTPQIIVYALLPACLGLLIHILQTVADICLAVQFLKSEESVWGGITLGLILAPAFLGAIFTLSQPENWPGTSGANARYCFRHGFYHVVLFPVAAVHRYCRRIFWSMEALYVRDIGLERTKCLKRATEPSPLELYHFLQAFVQGTIQCLLQLCLMLAEDSFRDYDIVKLQMVSIISSLLRISMTTALYQRFQSQKLAGRNYPWDDTPEHATDSQRNANATQEPPNTSIILLSHRPISEDAMLPHTLKTLQQQDDIYRKTLKIPAENFLRHHQLPEKNTDKCVEFIGRPDDYVDLASCASGSMGPPTTPAPERPKDDVPFSILVRLSTVRDQLRYSAGVMIDEMLGHRRGSDYEYNEIDNPPAPTRALPPPPNGLKRDDAVSYTVCAFGWFFHLIARFLSLSSFMLFYPLSSILVLFLTYSIGIGVFLRLAVTERNIRRAHFSLFLGFVYIFVMLELKFRFDRPRRWFVLYFLLVTGQNILMTLSWYWWADWDSWWFEYVLAVVLGGSCLGASCAVLYFVLLKPQEEIVLKK